MGGDSASGKYTKTKDDGFLVTELPPGTWTQDYREWLEKELAEGRIKDYTDTSTDKDVHIVVKGIHENDLQRSLHTQFRKSNMHAFNHRGVITKYTSLNDILKEYAEVRLDLYERRRQHQIKELQGELPYHEQVMRFIEDQISDTPRIDLRRKTHKQCLEILAANDLTETEAILKLPVSSFTAESIQKHQAKFRSLQDEIDGLQRSTPNNLWIADLQEIDL